MMACRMSRRARGPFDMTRIAIDLPSGYTVAASLRRASATAGDIRAALGSQWSRLDSRWDGSNKERVQNRVNDALREVGRLSDHFYSLGTRLDAIMHNFENADEIAGVELRPVGWSFEVEWISEPTFIKLNQLEYLQWLDEVLGAISPGITIAQVLKHSFSGGAMAGFAGVTAFQFGLKIAGREFMRPMTDARMLVTGQGKLLNVVGAAGFVLSVAFNVWTNSQDYKGDWGKIAAGTVIDTAAGLVFTAGGAALGGLVGSVVGPAGTVVGAKIGGAVGGIVGGYIYENYLRDGVHQFAFGTAPQLASRAAQTVGQAAQDAGVAIAGAASEASRVIGQGVESARESVRAVDAGMRQSLLGLTSLFPPQLLPGGVSP